MTEKREEFIQEGRQYLFEIYENEKKYGNDKEMSKIFNEINDGDKLDEHVDNEDKLLNSINKE